MTLREKIVHLKNTNPYVYYIWTLRQQQKGKQNLKRFSDKEAISALYKDFSGRYPDLENPQTFSEKLQWLKLNYRPELMTKCADKYEVRDYLKSRGYAHLLNEELAVYEKIQDLDIHSLPNQFVIKATHGSGWNLIVPDKTKVKWWIWKKIMNVWLHNNIFWPGREWPYKDAKPRLVAEAFLKDGSGALMDYKFFCFHGKAHFVQVNRGRSTGEHVQNFYDLDWNVLPFGKTLAPKLDADILAPENLQEMIRISEDLSADFPFVRVDLYDVAGKIIFGELTFYPKSGLPDFTLPGYDEKYGALIDLSRLK